MLLHADLFWEDPHTPLDDEDTRGLDDLGPLVLCHSSKDFEKEVLRNDPIALAELQGGWRRCAEGGGEDRKAQKIHDSPINEKNMWKKVLFLIIFIFLETILTWTPLLAMVVVVVTFVWL